MTIAAAESGILIPDGLWEGKVVSVHEGLINILHPGGLIVSVLMNRDRMHPFGVMLRPGDYSLIGAAAGLMSVYDGCSLSIAGKVVIDLTAATRWSGEVAPSRHIPDTRALAAHLKEAIIQYNDGTNGFGQLAAGAGLDRFSLLADQLLKKAAARRGLMNLSGLVGLGIGLTPSGDDFLAGALLGETLFGTAPSSNKSGSIDRNTIRAGLGGTSHAGRTLLSGVLADQFPAYLVDLAETLRQPGTTGNQVSAAVSCASHHGATSGIDSCTGLWWYIGRMLSR